MKPRRSVGAFFRFVRASRGKELAARLQQLDKLIDPSTPDEERKMRKQRLLKGPKEFRDISATSRKQKVDAFSCCR